MGYTIYKFFHDKNVKNGIRIVWWLIVLGHQNIKENNIYTDIVKIAEKLCLDKERKISVQLHFPLQIRL